jgi:hypothetical protein
LVILLALAAGCLAMIFSAYAVRPVIYGGSEGASATPGDPIVSVRRQTWWLASAGPSGAVTLSTGYAQGQGMAAHGWAREQGVVWTAAYVFDVAAVRPPAATLVTRRSEKYASHVLLVADGGAKTLAEEVDPSTDVRALARVSPLSD